MANLWLSTTLVFALLACAIAPPPPSGQAASVTQARYINQEWAKYSNAMTSEEDIDLYVIVLLTRIWQHVFRFEDLEMNFNVKQPSQTELDVGRQLSRLSLWPGDPSKLYDTYRRVANCEKYGEDMAKYRSIRFPMKLGRSLEIAPQLQPLYNGDDFKADCKDSGGKFKCKDLVLVKDLVQQCKSGNDDEQTQLRIKAALLVAVLARFDRVKKYIAKEPDKRDASEAFTYGRGPFPWGKVALKTGISAAGLGIGYGIGSAIWNALKSKPVPANFQQQPQDGEQEHRAPGDSAGASSLLGEASDEWDLTPSSLELEDDSWMWSYILVVLIVLFLLTLAAAGFYYYKYLYDDGTGSDPTDEEKKKEEEAKKDKDSPSLETYRSSSCGRDRKSEKTNPLTDRSSSCPAGADLKTEKTNPLTDRSSSCKQDNEPIAPTKHKKKKR